MRPTLRQLPVRSPLSARALVSGLRAATSRRGATEAREAVASELGRRYGVARVVLTDSGTNALRLAILGPGERPSRLVALPAYGCYDLATATDGSGVPFVLYDIDPTTLGPDEASLRRTLAAGADCVVVAHLHGIPVDLREVRAAAAVTGARVIDDAAQGAGASLDGRPLGACGDVGVVSFGRGKGITGGSGGALLFPREAEWPTAEPLGRTAHRGSIREVIALAAQWLLARPGWYAIPSALPFLGLGETNYRLPHPPASASAFAVGALSVTLGLADEESGLRRQNAARLREAMRASALAAPTLAAGAVGGFLRAAAVASASAAVEAARPEARNLGVMPGYPRALPDLRGFGERRENPEERFPGARLLAERLVTLPTHGALREVDLARLERWCARLS